MGTQFRTTHRQNTCKAFKNKKQQCDFGGCLENGLSIFEGSKIRKTWHNEEWWFSVVDIVDALTNSEDPRNYWKVLKFRLSEENGNQPVTFCNQLKLVAEDGKMRETDCVNTEGAFRIIQSIPSPKAEPFKLWLAKVGYERVQEIQDPELAQKRMKNFIVQKDILKNGWRKE